MTDIVIAEFMDFDAVRDALSGYQTLYDPKLVDEPAALSAALHDARALIVRNRVQVRAALLSHAPSLRVVGRLGVGLDNIDVDACAARGIAVCPASGANDLSVAEYVITAALLLLRRAWFATTDVANGSWPRMTAIGREISGKQLGLIGYGAIARQTAARARALGMSIVAHDPYLATSDATWRDAANVSLERLLETSDVVSLHVPLTDGTRHLIDAGALARMKHDAILINAARGGVVDEAAVAAALRAQRLGGAALDVFANEPVSATHGALFSGIRNVILTPHIAGVTEESNVRVSHATVANVLKHLRR